MTATRLASSAAEKALSDVLIGAVLESILTHSVNIRLAFLSDRLKKGALTEVDLSFICDASALAASAAISSGPDAFVFTRPAFLATAYELIGSEVWKLEVDGCGALKLQTSRGSISLKLGEDDLNEDGWVWLVSLKGDQKFQRGGSNLGCYPGLDEIEFHLCD